jgi:methionyl-tRNA formyltransferase
MNVVFMGSPEIVVPSLKAVMESPHRVVGVVAQPDKPVGRGLEMHSPSLAGFAKEKGLPLFQPASIRKNPEFLETLRSLKPDVIAIAAYGQILPKEILDLPPHGCINVHFSLLPKYRGAAPLQWALINGDEDTGVTIFRLKDGTVDSGPILMQKKVMVHDEDNADILGKRLAVIGAELLIETLDGLADGSLEAVPQNDRLATRAPMLKKEDGHVDWTRKAKAVWGQIRGMTPWPGAFTSLKGKRLKIHAAELVDHPKKGEPGEILEVTDDGLQVACGQGSLLIKDLQLEGGKRLAAAVFLKGHPLAPGERLGP